MRRTGTGPSVLGPSGPSVPTTGTSVPFITTPGANFCTNSVNDIRSPGTCPICARKWQNALARVLGMTGTGQNSALPVTGTGPVNVPSTYVQSRGFVPQEYITAQKNAYPSSEIVGSFGGNNVATSFNANNLAVNNAGANNYAANNAGANNYVANNGGANNYFANNAGANNAGVNNYAANNAGVNNLAALLSRSMPNNAHLYPEVVMVGNNGLRN
ncbi:hypothetical protein O0L34_g13282 [Tuta absoluta]|nr:hypothetical protein O0L34_g13282 [Tuta absoluta]